MDADRDDPMDGSRGNHHHDAHLMPPPPPPLPLLLPPLPPPPSSSSLALASSSLHAGGGSHDKPTPDAPPVLLLCPRAPRAPFHASDNLVSEYGLAPFHQRYSRHPAAAEAAAPGHGHDDLPIPATLDSLLPESFGFPPSQDELANDMAFHEIIHRDVRLATAFGYNVDTKGDPVAPPPLVDVTAGPLYLLDTTNFSYTDLPPIRPLTFKELRSSFQNIRPGYFPSFDELRVGIRPPKPPSPVEPVRTRSPPLQPLPPLPPPPPLASAVDVPAQLPPLPIPPPRPPSLPGATVLPVNPRPLPQQQQQQHRVSAQPARSPPPPLPQPGTRIQPGLVPPPFRPPMLGVVPPPNMPALPRVTLPALPPPPAPSGLAVGVAVGTPVPSAYAAPLVPARKRSPGPDGRTDIKRQRR
ncbi:hypothetical protein BC828DRAFT_402799 [Blastocladiella britannica]|nr:hypothetical protein BC828DRAFT_402799 [Blastocladiella britannica]